VNKSSVALTEEDINGVVYSLEHDEKADFDKKGWIIACHPIQLRYMKLFDYGFRERSMDDKKTGMSVSEFEADNGKVFKVVKDWHYPASVMTIHNDSGVQWGYFKNYKMLMERLAIDATDVTKKKLSCMIWGTMFRNPRQNIGMIYGLPTTYSG
jgi:hypothetical protein